MTRIKRHLWRRAPGFVLEHRLSQYVGLSAGADVHLPHVHLSAFGVLTLTPGFEWDGPSGPTLKTLSTMRASAVHDALYSLIKAGLLPRETRKVADAMLRKLMLKDGAGHLRAWYFWLAVRLFGWLYV